MGFDDTLIGVVAGWLLGLASSVYFQDRSLKKQRHEETKERVYSPLFDEIEEGLNPLEQVGFYQAPQWKRITTEEHLGYLIEPPELYEQLKRFHRTVSAFNLAVTNGSKWYADLVKQDLIGKVTKTAASATTGAPIPSDKIESVSAGVGWNIFSPSVPIGDLPSFSKDFEKLKPYSTNLPDSFKDYLDSWKGKSEDDEVVRNFRTIREDAIRNAKLLVEVLRSKLSPPGSVPNDHAETVQATVKEPSSSREERELRAEERRAVALFGVLAVVVGIWAALWEKAQTQQDFFFNFPGNAPLIHFTLYVIPFFQYLIGYWVVYAICMYFYFSNDWFEGHNSWQFVRRWLHAIGQLFEGVYVLTVGYVVIFGALGFYTPEYVQSLYWGVIYTTGFFLTVYLVVEAALGGRGLLFRRIRASVRALRAYVTA